MRILAIAMALLLVSCGFELRGNPSVGLKTVNITGTGGTLVEIKRILATGPTLVVPNAKDAEAQLRIIDEKREKTVHTITATGREQPLIEPTEVVATRLITYSESAPTAKEAEEQLLFKDMQVDIAGRILRHIAVVRHEP